MLSRDAHGLEVLDHLLTGRAVEEQPCCPRAQPCWIPSVGSSLQRDQLTDADVGFMCWDPQTHKAVDDLHGLIARHEKLHRTAPQGLVNGHVRNASPTQYQGSERLMRLHPRSFAGEICCARLMWVPCKLG